jgi:hypothetical protein
MKMNEPHFLSTDSSHKFWYTVTALILATPGSTFAQQYIDLEKNQRQQQLNQTQQQYREKKERWLNRNNTPQNPSLGAIDGAANERSLSNPWQVRTTRYACAGGVSLETNQRTASVEILAQLQERIERRTPTSSMVTLSKVRMDELEALDEIDSNLKSEKPLTLIFKHKRYELKLERGALGWQYINRGQGVSWTVRGGKGALKNAFSGRVLANECKARSPLITDSQSSSEEDELIAKLKKP